MPEYKINDKLNGVEIYFETKPNDNILNSLRENNWRWHKEKKCWYTKKTEASLAFAEKLCNANLGDAPPPKETSGNHQGYDREKVIIAVKLMIEALENNFDDTEYSWKTEYENYSCEQLVELLDKLMYKDKSLRANNQRRIQKLPYHERRIFYGTLYSIESKKNEVMERLSIYWYHARQATALLDNDCQEIRNQKRFCVDCGEIFFLKKEEVEFYLSKELSIPKRCVTCREKTQLLHASSNAHTYENPLYYNGRVLSFSLVGTENEFWRGPAVGGCSSHAASDRYNYELNSWLDEVMKERIKDCLSKIETEQNQLERRRLYYDIAVCYCALGNDSKKEYYAQKYLET